MRTAAPARPGSVSPGRTRGRRRRAMRIAGAALASAAIMCTVLATPARADPGAVKPFRIGVVAASDQYAVLAEKRGSLLSTRGQALSFVGRTGGRHALLDFDPQLFPDLKGSMLTEYARPNYRYDDGARYDPAAPEYVRWRDLRTGAHGIGELPAGDDYLGAGPGGWLATRTPGPDAAGQAVHIVQYATDGTVTDLGAPFPAGVPTTELLRGSAGVLAVSALDVEEFSVDGTVGAIRYVPYRAPGRWRTVYRPGASARVDCGRPSRSHVVCEVDGASGHSGEVLVPLDGGKRRWIDDHPSACQTNGFVTVGHSAFAKDFSTGHGCVAGRVEQLSSAGVLTTSSRRYGGRGNSAAGLGGLLFATKDERTILRLTSARGTPTVVAIAR